MRNCGNCALQDSRHGAGGDVCKMQQPAQGLLLASPSFYHTVYTQIWKEVCEGSDTKHWFSDSRCLIFRKVVHS